MSTTSAVTGTLIQIKPIPMGGIVEFIMGGIGDVLKHATIDRKQKAERIIYSI
jgi:hypothetical protein